MDASLSLLVSFAFLLIPGRTLEKTGRRDKKLETFVSAQDRGDWLEIPAEC